MRALSNAITTVVVWMIVKVRAQDGQTMAEYGILIAWLALVIIVGAKTLGTSIVHSFNTTAARV
jgi:Flp pilus assembly pilin Flp